MYRRIYCVRLYFGRPQIIVQLIPCACHINENMEKLIFRYKLHSARLPRRRRGEARIDRPLDKHKVANAKQVTILKTPKTVNCEEKTQICLSNHAPSVGLPRLTVLSH